MKKKEEFECALCGKRYKTKRWYENHVKSHVTTPRGETFRYISQFYFFQNDIIVVCLSCSCI